LRRSGHWDTKGHRQGFGEIFRVASQPVNCRVQVFCTKESVLFEILFAGRQSLLHPTAAVVDGACRAVFDGELKK